MDFYEMTASELSAMIRKGEVSSEEVTVSVLSRIEEIEKTVNAYITVIPEKAIERARELDSRKARGEDIGPLGGIPFAIKDSILTKDVRTTAGSRMLENFIPPYDANVIQRLNSAGAVIIGKTNTDEFTMGSTCETSYFGISRNPHNTAMITGGSSGGSAAAVAADECIVALGSDTGGSIRQPASFCGIVGMKPTYGRVSRNGLIAHASSFDQIGPMTKTVEDSAIVLGVIAGHDSWDSTCLDVEVPDYRASVNSPVKGLRVGVPKEYFREGIDPEIEEITLRAIKTMRSEGVEIKDISLPYTEYAVPTYYLLTTAEASANLERFDGVRYGYRSKGHANLAELYSRSRSEAFGNEVKNRIMLGTYCLSAGYYDAYYRKAQKVRRLVKDDFDRVLGEVDAILAPVSPSPASPLGTSVDDPLKMYLADIFTISLNLAGLPGIAVPAGKTSAGLPVGVQFMCRALEENVMFSLAGALERNVGRIKVEGGVR